MSKLDDITRHIYDHSCGYADVCNIETLTSAQAKERVKDLMLELIGENQPLEVSGYESREVKDTMLVAIITENLQRDLLRQKVNEL